ncbi:MAG: choice-of-anchor D domain-containing protein, partial [Verrucomicrobiales bacterium]|nr:choice-of-anchor D domain-containing protein [Verrucomicrobiales bacterium]
LAVTTTLHADVFYPIADVEVDTSTTDLWPISNLIQGPGVGFEDLDDFHDSLGGGATGAWVTAAPAGFPSDYIEDVGMPVIIFDLGSDTLLDEISIWGYSTGNANGCSVFDLRFATDSEGNSAFGTSITYNPTFNREFPEDVLRESFEFSEQVTARFVELVCVDNWWDDQLFAGGDRVGLSEVAFRVATETGGPNILLPGNLRLLNNGTSQTIEINVFNNGDAALNISSIDIGGTDQASYTPGPAPGSIAPNASAMVTVAFDPAGITGDSTVSVNFSSNDPDEPTKTLELTLAFPSFYTVQDVLSTSDVDFAFNPDLWPSSNLIQGPGFGFDANPPHDKILGAADGNWVTADDAGFPSDYIEDVTLPVLRLDLGEDSLLTEISVWGYASSNANGVKDFSLRFATAADGATGFGTSVTYNPVYNELPNDDTTRQSFPFELPVTARYVELTCLDNFWNPGGAPPGGDRVGLGEISFEIPVVGADATLEAPLSLALDLDGTVQTFSLNVRNTGGPDLTVSGLSFSGNNSTAFSQVSVPGPITTFTSGELSFSFNPAGLAGPITATLEIASNDPGTPSTEVQLAGILHDPQIAAVTPDLFLFPAGSGPQNLSLLVGNIGATQTLNISDISVSGPSGANFAITNPPASIDPSDSTQLTFTFDPLGADGSFAASIDITTDDPVNPVVSVPVSTRIEITDPLVAYWPLDDAPDTTDVAEALGNHPGTSISNFLTFGTAGARAYSGTSATFDGIDNTIEVPFDEALNPTSFTIVAWALPLDNFAAHQSVVTSRADAFPDLGGYVLYNAPSGNWEYWSGAGIQSDGWNTVSGGAVNIDEWVHLALTYDETTRAKTIYVNGAEAGTTTISIQPNGSLIELPQSNFHIGSGADDGSQFFFNGSIDEVAVFRTALSAPEIQNIIDDGIAATYLDPTPASGGFSITSFAFDPVTKRLDLTYANPPAGGAALVLRRSTDLINWVAVDDNVTASPLSFTDNTLPAGATKVYYRLDNQPE